MEGITEQRVAGRSLHSVLVNRNERLRSLGEVVEPGERIVGCYPMMKNGGVCLVAFRDHGDSVFEADVVTLALYICQRTNGVRFLKSVTLARKDPGQHEPWQVRIVQSCHDLCGNGSHIHRLRTFSELRHDMEQIGTALESELQS